MEKITIYTNESCLYCKQVKEELTKNNIKFENRLTSKFKIEWTNIVGLTNLPTVPTIYYKENYFIPGRDFNTATHLVNIIKDFEVCSFPNEIQILERFKTLNYNIGTAFKNLDQLLKQIETKLNIENEYKSNN